MQLREALLAMAPNVTLQRAAADEIARLDAYVIALETELKQALRMLEQLESLARPHPNVLD